MIDVGPAKSSKFRGLLLESNHVFITDCVTKSQICAVTINDSTCDTTQRVFLSAKDGREDQKKASGGKGKTFWLNTTSSEGCLMDTTGWG